MTVDVKTCRKCGIAKPFAEFREVTQRKWTYRINLCRECERAGSKTPEARAKANERTKRSYRRHTEKIKAKAKDRYWNDPERFREECRQYRNENPEEYRLYRRTYYKQNQAKMCAATRKHQQAHREERAAYMKKWREENRERLLEYGRQYNAERAADSREYMRAKRAAMSPEERQAIAQADYKRSYKRNPARHIEAARRHQARKKNAPVVEKIDRAAIIARDNSTCYLCGTHLELKQITLDHLTPLVRGGSHTADNLKVACRSCNSKKHTRTAEEYLNSTPA